MKYEIINCEQGTAEWHAARRGVITGTTLECVMKEGRKAGTPSKERIGLIYELIGGQTAIYEKVDFKTSAMERGHLGEGAIKEIEEIQSVGFIKRTDIPWLGLSPDGVRLDGEIITHATEVKTPEPKAYVQYAIENADSIPDKYYWQVVMYFIVIDTLETLDFITLCPEMQDERCRKHIVRVTREELAEDIKRAQEALTEFRAQWQDVLRQYIHFFTAP